MATTVNLRPFRDYDEHDVINLFAHRSNDVNKGSLVALETATGWKNTNEPTMEEGVIEIVGDGNIGSIMGIGFPAQTGGAFQAINAYGLKAFVERARELEARYGEVFAVPALLAQRAEQGQTFV